MHTPKLLHFFLSFSFYIPQILTKIDDNKVTLNLLDPRRHQFLINLLMFRGSEVDLILVILFVQNDEFSLLLISILLIIFEVVREYKMINVAEEFIELANDLKEFFRLFAKFDQFYLVIKK